MFQTNSQCRCCGFFSWAFFHQEWKKKSFLAFSFPFERKGGAGDIKLKSLHELACVLSLARSANHDLR